MKELPVSVPRHLAATATAAWSPPSSAGGDAGPGGHEVPALPSPPTRALQSAFRGAVTTCLVLGWFWVPLAISKWA